MKQIILMATLAVMWHANVKACDACGCAASSQFTGLLPNYDNNFIGLQYQFSSLSADYSSAYIGRPEEHTHDQYNSFQLWGRHNIGKNYQLFAFVPYQYNVRTRDGIVASGTGIGDVSFLLNRVLLNSAHVSWSHALTAGAGLKTPTGKYANITVADNHILPNIQPGTGSWDVITNVNYTIKHGRTGLNADAAYNFTTTNKYSYKYGNRLNCGIAGFYSLGMGQVNIIPNVGLRYEYALHDYDNYKKNWLNDESGGSILLATAGAQAYFKHIGARVTWQQPLSQRYGNGTMTIGQKIETSIFFLF